MEKRQIIPFLNEAKYQRIRQVNDEYHKKRQDFTDKKLKDIDLNLEASFVEEVSKVVNAASAQIAELFSQVTFSAPTTTDSEGNVVYEVLSLGDTKKYTLSDDNHRDCYFDSYLECECLRRIRQATNQGNSGSSIQEQVYGELRARIRYIFSYEFNKLEAARKKEVQAIEGEFSKLINVIKPMNGKDATKLLKELGFDMDKPKGNSTVSSEEINAQVLLGLGGEKHE
jgi:hypothetical protein